MTAAGPSLAGATASAPPALRLDDEAQRRLLHHDPLLRLARVVDEWQKRRRAPGTTPRTLRSEALLRESFPDNSLLPPPRRGPRLTLWMQTF